MLAVGSQAEAVAMALIRWYFQWAGAMGRVISARWLSLPPKMTKMTKITKVTKLKKKTVINVFFFEFFKKDKNLNSI